MPVFAVPFPVKSIVPALITSAVYGAPGDTTVSIWTPTALVVPVYVSELSTFVIVKVFEELISTAGIVEAVEDEGISIEPVETGLVVSVMTMSAGILPEPAVEVLSAAVVLDVIVSVSASAGLESNAIVTAVSKRARLYTSNLTSVSSAGVGGPGNRRARALRRGYAPERPQWRAP